MSNPFKVGDKVMLKESAWREWYSIWYKSGYKHQGEVIEVVGVCGDQLITSVDKDSSHYSHFEIAPNIEETTMNKTKRVPFSVEDWEKYKDVAKVYLKGSLCDRFVFLTATNKEPPQGFALYSTPDEDFVHHYSVWEFTLEIPITTKRILFNPDLKDAKVFYGKIQLIEWFALKSGLVCGTYEWAAAFKGLESTMYHPSDLEMEVEE